MIAYKAKKDKAAKAKVMAAYKAKNAAAKEPQAESQPEPVKPMTPLVSETRAWKMTPTMSGEEF